MIKIAEMVQKVTKSIIGLGLSIIAEEWENYDGMMCSRKNIRHGWHTIKKDNPILLTSIVSVVYSKTCRTASEKENGKISLH